jgi:protein O-GlcNAc transferase
VYRPKNTSKEHLNSAIAFPEVQGSPVCQSGYITFGAFNRIEKYNQAVYALWANILTRIPAAKLLIKTNMLNSPQYIKEMQANFSQHGVSPERLILMGNTSKQEHLKTHNQIDIMLDPFPHNGGITTLESLRMGVPVLTCEQKTRCPTSASILHVLGLDEWRAGDETDYANRAVQFANDVQSLKILRQQLRNRFDESVLGNSQLYVSEVEAIYQQLWHKWCKNVSG